MTESGFLNDRYQLLGVLGSGGMAVVYKVQDRMLERTVAIKVLREKYSNDPAFRERFRQEAKAAANLSHPNIVMVHDFGYDEKRLFIVMEYVPGENLKTLIEKKGIFDVEEAIRLAVQICAGVGYAHRAGLVHCDMKPHNVLVMPDQRLKVADFGIARALTSINPNEKSQIVWGSPQYFSPEQARGLAPSPASDVYGIGVMLYQMLTGRLPFRAENAVDLARLHRDQSPQPPITLNRRIPMVVNDILMKVLSKEPSARYRTADQLGRVLLSFSDEAMQKRMQTAKRPAAQAESSALPHPSPVPPVRSDHIQPVQTNGGNLDPEEDELYPVDWVNVFLGLLALVAVGGLIPFAIWVYFTLNGPG